MGESVGVFIGVAGVVIAAFSVAIAYSSTKRQQKRETSTDSTEKGELKAKMESDIDYTKRRTDDILFEVRDMRKCQGDFNDRTNERLTRCEESAKGAHHRLDGIEAKLK